MAQKIKYTPVGNNIHVEPDSKEKVTQSGLHVVQDEQSAPTTTGTVLGVGPDVEDIKVGDRVVYSAYGGVTYEVGDKKYLVMTEYDVVLREVRG